MSAVRAVLFDFGNTLFAHAPLTATIAAACERLGSSQSSTWAHLVAARVDALAHTADELLHQRDLDAVVWRERWHQLYAVADDEVPGLGAELYDAMHDPLAWRPYVCTAVTLSSLHRMEVPVAIVSNTGWDIRAVFAAHHMQQLVNAFVLSYEVGAVKPGEAIFHRACSALGVPPSDALMVGDDPVADGGAVRAGLRTLLLPALEPGAANGVEAAAQILSGE